MADWTAQIIDGILNILIYFHMWKKKEGIFKKEVGGSK